MRNELLFYRPVLMAPVRNILRGIRGRTHSVEAMSANKPSDAIPEVMKRRVKELERDGYNEDFLRCFRNAIKKLERLEALQELQRESEGLGMYADFMKEAKP